ncbi:MAG: type 1 glutamine amidotransferase [Balneolaceae bacterium]|nr:type 1 glutamine amidotransferase [Balneolaceae bacterium]
MRNSRPKIGVTGPVRGGTAAWLFTRFAVWLQGGTAVRITPDRPLGDRRLDGLILGGGADIDPQQYGRYLEREETGGKSPGRSGVVKWLNRVFSLFFYPFLFLARKVFAVSEPSIDRSRDELELNLLEESMRRRLPVLGICRGAQLINVKLGGTLHQDIRGFYGEIPQIHTIWPRKEVRIDPKSRLGEILQSPRVVVNALHRQAVETLGDPLQAVAKEKNGIIQAVELPDYPYMIGVQWHPEYMPQIESQRKIFRALVKRAGDGAQRDHQVSTS